jgi:hypothetical protein
MDNFDELDHDGGGFIDAHDLRAYRQQKEGLPAGQATAAGSKYPSPETEEGRTWLAESFLKYQATKDPSGQLDRTQFRAALLDCAGRACVMAPHERYNMVDTVFAQLDVNRTAFAMDDFVRCFTSLDELLVAKSTAELFSATTKKGPAAYKLQSAVTSSLSRSLTAH